MPTRTRHTLAAPLALAVALGVALAAGRAAAATRGELARDSEAALQDLLASTPAASALAGRAKGILVFPSIVKGGFLFGGQYGEGALIKGDRAVAYYNTIAVSYGFQAGLQKFGYALFFMTRSALAYLDKSDGWELGTGPSLTVIDEGFAKSFSTTTLKSDVYAFFFNQAGLMGGIGVQGSKITRITPDP